MRRLIKQREIVADEWRYADEDPLGRERALILPFAVDAFSIFLVRQYVLGLPLELEEAARVDGATDWGIFRGVVLPLMKPVLAVVAIQSFLTNWNSFLFPLVFVEGLAGHGAAAAVRIAAAREGGR